MSGDFLTVMAQGSLERLQRARAACPESTLRVQALACERPTPLRLSSAGFDLIAELKLRSPAAGVLGHLQAEAQIDARVTSYAQAGACAVSVLTEPSRFDGELAHLTRAARALTAQVPVMRKDFLVDPYQVYEARVAGASGVLLILRMLAAAQLQAMLQACAELGVFALLEAFDEADLGRAGELTQTHGGHVQLLVGVNCRDLSSLQVVPGRLEALAARLPSGVPHVAESGLDQPAEAARLAAVGYRVALVGSALMRAEHPAALVRAMLAAGRSAATGADSRVHACGSRSAG